MYWKKQLRYRKENGKTPTLFIDGANLLAKHEPDPFVHVLVWAKILTNNGKLTIVLVSSEGSVVPIIQQTSGVSRCNQFFEICDVEEEMAVKYLMQGGFSKELAERLVNYVGGRCIYLVNSYRWARIIKEGCLRRPCIIKITELTPCMIVFAIQR